jgi:hypothetical protein
MLPMVSKKMLKGSAREMAMMVLGLSWVQVVSAGMRMGREVYRRWGRVVNPTPPHTPPSIIPPRIFAWPLFLSIWREERKPLGFDLSEARMLALGALVVPAVPGSLGTGRILRILQPVLA